MKRNKKTLLLLLLVLASVVLLVTGTFAAYTSVGTVKRVVSTRSGVDDLRFSSNYLTKSGEGYPPRPISIAEGSGVSIGVTVCNYSYNDLTLFSESPITYTLTARLVDSNGTPITDATVISYTAADGTTQTITGSSLKGKIFINGDSFTGDSYTATKTLPANAANHDLYRITCNEVDYPILRAIAIQMEAVPRSGTNQRLAGLLQVTAAADHFTSWQGGFIDPEGVDAFNYEIFGSAKGNLTLVWDSSLKITPWFEEDLKKQGYYVSSDDHSITFSVGNQSQPNHYRIQFYRINGANRGNVTYNFISESSAP